MYIYKRQKATTNQVIYEYNDNSRNKITPFQTFRHKPSSVINIYIYIYLYVDITIIRDSNNIASSCIPLTA